MPIDVYAALAVERGIAELAITDHVDFEPGAAAFAFVDFETRERVVREAAERWADRVAIRFGCELTYDRRHEEAIREHLARHRYDFTIGSVHIGVRSPFTKGRVQAHVASGRLHEVMAPYFDEVEAAARSGLFDTLGHLDVVKRYAASWIKPAAFAAAPELYEPTLHALVESGTGLEVNTSGLRQAPRETYPAPWVVARFRGARRDGRDRRLGRTLDRVVRARARDRLSDRRRGRVRVTRFPSWRRSGRHRDP